MTPSIDIQVKEKKANKQADQHTLDNIPVEKLVGVGPKIAEKLVRLGIRSAQDLLLHLPYRYEDRTKITAINCVLAGQKQLIEGRIESNSIVFTNKRMLLCRISDQVGSINLRFFHFNRQQQQALAVGKTVRCFGEVRFSFGNKIEMIHPEFTLINKADPPELAQSLTPVYPVTEGIHQLKLRKLIGQALVMIEETPNRLRDPIPATIIKKLNLKALHAAITFVHQPPASISEAEIEMGRSDFVKRLSFDELLAHHLGLRSLREKINKQSAPIFVDNEEMFTRFRSRLPFELTQAQERVILKINEDCQLGAPMQRLLQGDVGSGKTLVAAFAALHAIASGYQVGLMVPTEILAEQHKQSFRQWFDILGIKTLLLSGKLTVVQRRTALEQIASADAKMIIGTHALFQQDVQFSNLGLVIIDEQHRFGVHQRLALKEKGLDKGEMVHQLIMTATPIPRTLAMTAYADLDVSIIDELPAGRQAIKTVALAQDRRQEVVDRVHVNCQQGQQVYWVCTLIEESESLECQAAEKTAEQLSEALTDIKIGLVHGRMKSVDKEKAMQDFKQGEIDLLVATTVIEVGVDVPNASLIIIENAERLGLAQLHQLRGRVGRGSVQSHCVLLYQAPLSEIASQRISVMRESTDGFFIAQKDLEIRGPGEVLGTKQKGSLFFKIADLTRDKELLPLVEQCADSILEQWPERVAPIINSWIDENANYASV